MKGSKGCVTKGKKGARKMKLSTYIKELAVAGFLTLGSSGAYCQTVELWSTNIGGGYDDSWQPPSCEWRNEGILGLPSLHCGKPRALRHQLKLVVRGPNDENVRQAVNGCVQQGAIAAAIAGVGTAVVTGGAGTVVAVQTFINYVATCAGGYASQSISAGIEDNSHWVDL